ncbi:hypothetical protein ACFYTV_23260 [Streptomyces sp. NPDC004562]|uniref:hypothetical protein n=1 Tax=unclassified Streptomyces TaxID=2593676 RepID=UPI0036A2FE7C
MTQVEATRTPSPTSSAALGAWCAGLGLLATTSVFGLWLFGTDSDRRRLLILMCLATTLMCVVVIALRQRAFGGRKSVRDVALAASARSVDGPADEAPGSTLETADLPLMLPSRRGQQVRSLAWVAGIATALLAILALAAGTPQRSGHVERIHAAGAEFGTAMAEKISDVRRKSSRGKDPYIATVVVRLPAATGEEPMSAVVKATTNQPLSPGDPVTVLYAPSQPELGAVAGDERSLGAELRGETMPAYLRWAFVAAWGLSCLGAVSHMSTSHGFRSFSRLGEKDRAIRGRYKRVALFDPRGRRESSGGPTRLEIQTDAGIARFHTITGSRSLPELVEHEPLWVSWDAHRGARSSRFSPSMTPAALVFDHGLVLHGMMKVEEAQALDSGSVSLGKVATMPQGNRRLRLFDVRAQWPSYVDPFMFQICAVVIASAALMTFDVANGWRWTAGVVAFLGVWAAVGLHVSDDASSKRGTKG